MASEIKVNKITGKGATGGTDAPLQFSDNSVKFGPTAPASPVAGNMYYDTTSNTLKIYDGTSWYALDMTNSGMLATGGDLIASYTYSGTTYIVHKFIASGSWQTHSTLSFDVMMMAGGGSGGGTDPNGSGGGGAGELIWKSFSNITANTFDIVIGAGGGTHTSTGVGGDSAFDYGRALQADVSGGGIGGGWNGGGNANSRGSGGGSGRDANGAAAGGSTSGIAGESFQNDGGGCTPSSYGAGGGGGGAGGPGRTVTLGGGSGHGPGGSGAGDNTIYHNDGGGGIGNSTFINSSATETTAFLFASLTGTNASNVPTAPGFAGQTLYIGAGGGGAVYHSLPAFNALCTTSAAGGGGAGYFGEGGRGNGGIANTGGGGGGGRHAQVGVGGSGVAVIRYAI